MKIWCLLKTKIWLCLINYWIFYQLNFRVIRSKISKIKYLFYFDAAVYSSLFIVSSINVLKPNIKYHPTSDKLINAHVTFNFKYMHIVLSIYFSCYKRENKDAIFSYILIYSKHHVCKDTIYSLQRICQQTRYCKNQSSNEFYFVILISLEVCSENENRKKNKFERKKISDFVSSA